MTILRLIQMNKNLIITCLIVILTTAAVTGAWQLGFKQHNECAAEWYNLGYKVGSGKE